MDSQLVDAQVANALFTKTSILSLQGSAASCLLVPNGLRFLFPSLGKRVTRFIAFFIAMALSYLVAYVATDPDFLKWILAFFNGFLIFASAMGINQAASGGTDLGPGERKFFANWL